MKKTLFLGALLLSLSITTEASLFSRTENLKDEDLLMCTGKDEDGKLVNGFTAAVDHTHCQKNNIIRVRGSLIELVCDFTNPIYINSQTYSAICLYRGAIRNDVAFPDEE